MSDAPARPTTPLELAQRWTELAHEWTRWLATAALTAASPRSPASAGPQPATEAAPEGAGSTPPPSFDAERLAAVNTKFAERWRALWSAVLSGSDAQAPAPGSLPTIVEPARGDRRFAAREWTELPYFALLKQVYLLSSEYLQDVAALAPVAGQDRQRLLFATRQYVDALAPTNFMATNPEVLKAALETEGGSLARGLANLAADASRGRISMSDPTAFEIGRNLAVTPGSVVYRNELFELLQYAPTTARVHRRPVVIVPPCINKYFILDLQPQNSFVRWLVEQGHTVFMISWRNIPSSLGHLTWDDYLVDGALEAIEVAREVSRSRTVNTVGFCIGGTLLASALAVLAARGTKSVESATLLTTMLDFADPGEIGVYISDEMLAAREPALLGGQRVHGGELAGAFASLRANELVWNYVIGNYLKGETPPAFDLLYWNGESSNLPGPMYVYYLKNMYLENRLCKGGALTMAGEPVDLSRIAVPTYVFASRDDHIVPWRSAYRSTLLLGGDVNFVLGASGHIAGVVNPPGRQRRNYWTNPLLTDEADDWIARAESHPGSWWPDWAAWLEPHGGSMRPAPVLQGSAEHPALGPAPGRYVIEASD